MSITGLRIPLNVDPQRVRPEQSEVQALVSDNSLAMNLCGWRPKIDLVLRGRQNLRCLHKKSTFRSFIPRSTSGESMAVIPGRAVKVCLLPYTSVLPKPQR